MKKRLWLPAAAAAGIFVMRTGNRRDPRIEALKACRYYAHRGLHDRSRGIPENTLAAFHEARIHGYGAELDVQLTKDGIPVIYHDFDAARLCMNEDGTLAAVNLRDHTLEELQRLRVGGTEERIPTLADVLKEANGEMPLIIELKVQYGRDIEPLCRTVLSLLEDYKGLYCIESFDPRAVRWLYRNAPDVIRGQLYEDIYRADGEWMYRASANLFFGFLTRPDFIAYHWNHSGAVLGRICRTFMPAMKVCWTVKTPEQLEKVRSTYDAYIFEGFLPESQVDYE